MSKLKESLKRRQSGKPVRAKRRKLVTPELTLEQRMRLAAFDELMKWSDEQWAKMTPEQQKEEMDGWERVKQTMNGDRAGYRQVFIDE